LNGESTGFPAIQEKLPMPCSRRLTVIGLILFCAAAANAQYVDITRPGDPIQVVNGSDDGDGSAGDPPPSEVPAKAIDDFAQKYLNFKDLGSGFAVTPSANPLNLPVIGLRFYTANDFPSRDPASYILEGSNDSIAGPWVLISQGPLALPADRNTTTTDAIPPTGNLSLFHQTVLFSNTDPFLHYRVVFPTLKDASMANSMQIGEVEFLVPEFIVPEPGTAALAVVSVLGLAMSRRRRARV
jgi:hypothetical protein